MIAETTDERVAGIGELATACARAEYARILASLEVWEAELSKADPKADPFRHTAQHTAATVLVAQANGWSEYVAANRLHEAQTARDDLPNTWAGFAEGQLDSARVGAIAQASWKLSQAGSVERLDKRASVYAVTHTTAELKAWLRLFVARIEPDEAEQRYEQIIADRSVTVVHHDDGTGDLYANNFPSYVLANVERRLEHAAKRSQQTGRPDDGRTLVQRQADAFINALEHIDPTTEPVRSPNLTVGVMVTADTLAGLSDQPAVSADRDWTIPAHAFRQLAVESNPFWYKLLVADDQDVLAVEYKGRFTPDHLTQAIRFRDGHCRFPGCTAKAGRCEIDHRIPSPEGPTAGWNEWLLCKKHHQAKTFNTFVPAESPDHDDRWTWTFGPTALIG